MQGRGGREYRDIVAKSCPVRNFLKKRPRGDQSNQGIRYPGQGDPGRRTRPRRVENGGQDLGLEATRRETIFFTPQCALKANQEQPSLAGLAACCAAQHGMAFCCWIGSIDPHGELRPKCGCLGFRDWKDLKPKTQNPKPQKAQCQAPQNPTASLLKKAQCRRTWQGRGPPPQTSSFRN